MDIHSKRILNLIKKNSNLDLDISDIAFHLKLDEQFVQNFLQNLARKGYVTARQNQHGRVYWYAVAEPPKEVKEEEISTFEKDSGKTSDDEFDALAEGGGGFPVAKVIAFIIVIAILGGGLIMGSKYVEKRVNSVTTTATKDLLPRKEFDPFKDTAMVKIGNIQSEIKGLYGVIDSLKRVLASIDSTSKIVPEEKKPVKKPVKKKK
jgi:predicted DNA-binding transcriptional regulator